MEEALALEQNNLEQDQRRELESAKKGDQPKSKAAELVEDKLKKEAKLLARRAVLRFINSAFALTVVGLIVTYVIMSIQVVAGNYFGSKIIPGLSSIEVWIWVFISLLLFLSINLTISMFAFLMAPFIDPGFATKVAWKIMVDFFGNIF